MVDRLKNRVAIVTGSGRGIGKEIALALAREGARVVVNDLKPGIPGGDADTTTKEIVDMGGQATAFYCDVANFEKTKKLIQTAIDSFGRIDILVNNAGILMPRMIWDMSEEDWDKVINVHLKGSFNCIRHASVLMKNNKWGRMINSTSGSWLGTPGMCNYGSAKAGIVGLTRSVARDLGRYGVTCNAFHPMALTRLVVGPGTSDILEQRYKIGQITKEQYERAKRSPMPPAEAVGPLVTYLASQEASNINGQVFYVAGGHIAIYSEPVRKYSIHKSSELGLWTLEELEEQIPKELLKEYKNPAPAEIS
ncbi:SDR family NAD(P)-dependent oxidoreductase [Chloroflexota bacterium]